MQPGDQICLLDGMGWEYMVRLTGLGKEYAAGEIVEKKAGAGEPKTGVTLYLSLLNKADKFEWALQKCTEIGAAGLCPCGRLEAFRICQEPPGRNDGSA